MAGQVERQRARFAGDPADRVAFETLEEHYFLQGAWSELTGLYEARLEALQADPAAAARVGFRLGQVLEERCQNPDRAIECYRRAAELDPASRGPVRQLRRLHAARGQWEIALQLADVESRTHMRPYQRAEFLVELGTLWLARVGDPEQALEHYRGALEVVPDQEDALVGLARALERLGRSREAAESWQSALELLRGPDRAPALVARARLLDELGEREAAGHLYRSAFEEDPSHREAVDALAERATAEERWDELASLQERRFDLASGAIKRAAIALDAGRLHLDRLEDLAEARRWFSRALELFPEDPSLHLAMAELERRGGHAEARARHLERALELTDDDAQPELIDEVAQLNLEQGDPASAADHYRRALDQAPEDERLLESLAQSLAAAGRDAELAEVLERRAAALEGDPQRQAELLVQLGALHEERLDDLAAARDAYERARRAHPARPRLAAALDRVLGKLGDQDGRRALLEEASDSAPAAERPGLLCALGELLHEDGRDGAGTVRAFERALELEPGLERALAGLARVAAASGDEDGLLRTYQREASVTGDPERSAALATEILRLCEAREEPERALPAVERWVASAPDDPAAVRALARLQESLGRTEELVRTLERLEALVAGAERATTRRRLGFLHAAEGREERAIAAWRAVLEMEPDDVATLEALRDALAEGDPQELASVQRRLVDLLPPEPRAACLIALADLLATRLDDAAGAVGALERVLDEGQETPDVARRLEELLDRVGRHDELLARLDARRARLAPDDAELQALDLRRAQLLLDPLGRYEEASALFRELHRREPGSREILQGLERAARACNDHEGLADWLEARAEEEEDPEQRARLALERAVLLDERLGRPEEARSVYEVIVEGPRTSAAVQDAAHRLETLLERTGEHAALCERLEARLMHVPQEERAALHLRVGRIARQRVGDRARALYHLEAAAKLAPERDDVWRGLAQLNEELHRMPELLRALEGELATNPDAERELALRARAGRLCAGSLDDPERAEQHYLRVLELDPAHAEAGEFALVRLERDARFEEMARILEARLAGLEGEASHDLDHRAERRTALRLRLAALRAEHLDDRPGAVELLEAALEEAGAVSPVTEPLADLYQRVDRNEELAALCRRAAESADRPAERADWMLRLGGALRACGDEAGAAEAYRGVLVERPDDRHARASLRELYRQLGEAEPLVRLLEYELRHAAGEDEVPLRLELASLQEDSLGHAAEAFAQLRRVLELRPGDTRSLERALSLADALDRPEEALELADAALARSDTRLLHGTLWARRGTILADGLGELEEAVASFRRAVELGSGQAEVRRSLRRTLETLERWPEALQELRRESDASPVEMRSELVEHGARVAEQHVSPDAAVPWYEQLRALRPDDPEPLFRLADIHRRAGRAEALERALAEAAARLPEGDRRRDLERERAEVLERRLNAPERAVAALEDARRMDPAHPELRTELERLYEQTGRGRELAALLAEQLGEADGEARGRVLGRIAAIHSDLLDDPEAAVDALRRALAADNLPATARIDLLRRLGEAYAAAGRADDQARVAEEELAALPAGEAVFRERRFALRLELARLYERELGRPEAALGQLRALLDDECGEHDESEGWAQRDEAERRLIELLRSQGSDVELARRLAERLTVEPSAEGWLELARLREERLWAPAAAADAYREVLTAQPGCPDAWRGLRRVSERVGDWAEVARTLEQEIEHAEGLADDERSVLRRRLGQICWERLGDTTRASRAFAAALDTDASDLVALRALARLLESMEDWRGALDAYTRELELLGEQEDARRQEVWLRTAALHAERLEDPEQASRAFASAALIGALPCHARAEWARLLHGLGRLERYASVFASWCDDPEAGAHASDHVHLAEVLQELERPDEALERLERAVGCEDAGPEAWERLARAREDRDDVPGAAEAWARRGELDRGADAAAAFVTAARGLGSTDPERAAGLLVRAIAEDPTSPRAHAQLAHVAARLGRYEESERAAARAGELGVARDTFSVSERIETALAGAHSARTRGSFEAVQRFASIVLELDESHPEARALRGEARFERGDLAGAREDLETCLAGAASHPERAGHLTRIAAALEMEGDEDAALARYQEALALEPERDDAQAGIARVLERLGRATEAADALSRWAERAPDARSRANRLVQAAALEKRSGRGTEAERRLRLAVAADASHATAWQELATHLWEGGRPRDTLDVATRALDAISDGPTRPTLLELRARALEREGRNREAAQAYGEAARGDARAADAALAAARLLRGLGDWRAAGQMLAEFARDSSASDNPVGLARVLLHLGRLRAGPLEDIEGAVAAYRHALELEPELREAREALAGLLVHRPDEWDEAEARHVELLREDPTRAASIRALARIARERGRQDEADCGLALLRALGAASPVERRVAPERLPFPLAMQAALDDPAWETLRLLVREAGPALAEALGASRRPEGAAGDDPLRRFRDARLAATGELAAPALLPLPEDELRQVLRILARLSHEEETVHGEAQLVNAIGNALGRRLRRRLRRVLGEMPLAALESVDVMAWRRALRDLGAAVAVDRTDGDLRAALCAMLAEESAAEISGLPEEADLTPWVRECDAARRLLARALEAWRERGGHGRGGIEHG